MKNKPNYETGQKVKNLCIEIAKTNKYPQKIENGRYVMRMGKEYRVISHQVKVPQ